MTDADRPAFGEAMLVLGETFNEPVSDTRAEAYFSALSDLEIADVHVAVRQAIRQARFFPRPVEIREMVEGLASDNADNAWAEVLHQVRRVGYMGEPTFTDPRVLRTVNELWGGWRRLCETLPAEGPEYLGWVKQFKATFATQSRREAHAALTMGRIDPTVRKFIERKGKLLALPGDRPGHV